MNKAKYFSFASAVSTLEQSDIFLSVKLRILEAPKANLNGARVTEAFIDNVVNNAERYQELPLYADKKMLCSGNYNRLGHMYNQKTGEFYSTQIGSFYRFEKEEFKGGCYLIGYARVPKRDPKLSKAIAELFADGALKFSFEIACRDFTELDDGTIEIDASENNYLEGVAIVTFPACEDAVALEFVAQREAGNTEGGEMEMAGDNTSENTVPESEIQSEQTAAPVAEPVVETAENNAESTQKSVAETPVEGVSVNTENTTEVQQTENAGAENASVYVDEATCVTKSTYAYDTETGKSVRQSVTVTEETSQTVDGTIVETEDGPRVAEAGDESGDTPSDTTSPTTAEESGTTETTGSENAADDTVPRLENDEEKKKTAELIAELTETVKALAEEIKSLKEQKVNAAVEKLNVSASAINPFTDSMVTKGNSYDELLKPVEKINGYRDLLSR